MAWQQMRRIQLWQNVFFEVERFFCLFEEELEERVDFYSMMQFGGSTSLRL